MVVKMGLLDSFFGNADQTQALGLLGAHMMAGNTAGGFQAANGLLGSAPERDMKRKLMDAQLQETLAQAQERKANAQKAQQLLQRQAQIQAGLPALFGGGAPGGAPAVGGAPPMGTAPGAAQGSPGGFNVMEALRLGMDPKMIQEYAALQNLGRQKVARTMKGIGPDGKEYDYQVDEFGQKVGDGMAQFKAPHYQDLGGKVGVFDGYGAQTGNLGKTQTADSIASNAVTMRGQNMSDARARATAELGAIPSGYRRGANGLEFIPGGPADPNAAKRAAPTEFQGKSAAFGARAQEADKIIGSLDGKYSPTAVNAKAALDSVPGIGGALGAGANWLLTDSGQRVEQAQRDFVNAVLRQESGAAVSAGEFENAKKQYFPQPNDSEAVKQQKARNRAIAIQGFRENSRPGAVDAVAAGGGAPAVEQPSAAKPPVPMKGMVRGGYRFKGGDPADPSSWEKV